MASEHPHDARFFGIAVSRPFPDRLVHIIGREIDHDHPAICGDPAKHRVADVAWMAVDRLGARVGENDRRLGDIKRRVHRSFADMAEVDEHSDPVHLVNDLSAVVGHSVVLWNIGRAESAQSVVLKWVSVM